MSDLQAILDSIAYVAWHGCKVMDEGAGQARIAQPGRADLLNYFGAAHAGAMYTLAETAGGVAADSIARPLGAFILLRSAEVKYTRRAAGALEAQAAAEKAECETAMRRFSESGRADISIAVVICDSDEQPVFEGAFHYALRPRTS